MFNTYSYIIRVTVINFTGMVRKKMPGEIFEFNWFRHTDGYSVMETGTGAGQVAVIAANTNPARGVGDVAQYNPLRQHKCLFRTFAETDSQGEGILAFVNDYGLLGLDREKADPEGPPLPSSVESLSAWQHEIKAMRKALALWDMVQDEDSRGLSACFSPLISWVNADINGASERDLPDPATAFPDFEPDDLRWFRTHPEVIEWYRAGDMSVPALMRVQAIINRHLEKRISPRILWEDARRRRWSLYFTPVSLIGAIWLQFAQSVTQEKDYRRCRQCETWFEIDHYTARTNRYFCSNACRSKAYRDRQGKARALHGQGMDVAAIAEQLGSDEDTVSRWIAKAGSSG